MRALLAPYDKTDLPGFAIGLAGLGWELYSTGNTQRVLVSAGIAVRSVSELTGFPEILDGRVKTLHPGVHAGLLARRDYPAHLEELAAHGLRTIDMVVGGLYPFVATVAGGAPLTDALENIDIGGPAMIRAAAKNFSSVLVLVDPADYPRVLDALCTGEVPQALRRELAAKAFAHVSAYDAAVAEYLRGDEAFPAILPLAFAKLRDLRYGENPHQRGALYRDRSLAERGGGVALAEQLHGKEMSFVNYVDADGAWQAVWDFAAPCCVIVKHATPCGLAVHQDITVAYERALAGDPVSAYGGIVAFNRPVDEPLARAIREVRNPQSGQRQLYDVLIAPAYTDEGLRILRGKSKDLRLLRAEPPRQGGTRFRQVSGGLLLHDDDTFGPLPASPFPAGEERTAMEGEGQSSLSAALREGAVRVVTKRAPTADEWRDLAVAWRACKHVKSNAIVLVRDSMMIGMGAGQPNRVNSVMLATRAAGERARGSVLASDAFFPFADGVETAAAAGVTAVVQPGGSLRDNEVIETADRAGMAMIFTDIRHFRH